MCSVKSSDVLGCSVSSVDMQCCAVESSDVLSRVITHLTVHILDTTLCMGVILRAVNGGGVMPIASTPRS